MTTTFAGPGSALALSDEAQDLLFREARTASTFTDEPVSDEQVRAIYDLVKYAPTWSTGAAADDPGALAAGTPSA